MKILWNEAQLNMLAKMKVPFDVSKDITNGELELLYDIVPDFMFEKIGWDGRGTPSKDFNTCEDIITILARKMDEEGLLAK